MSDTVSGSTAPAGVGQAMRMVAPGLPRSYGRQGREHADARGMVQEVAPAEFSGAVLFHDVVFERGHVAWVLGWGGIEAGKGEEASVFFFEKKNQKTFGTLGPA